MLSRRTAPIDDLSVKCCRIVGYLGVITEELREDSNRYMIAPGTKPYVLRRSKHKMPWTSRLASPDDGMFKSETEKLNVSLILYLKPKKFKPQRTWGGGGAAPSKQGA